MSTATGVEEATEVPLVQLIKKEDVELLVGAVLSATTKLDETVCPLPQGSVATQVRVMVVRQVVPTVVSEPCWVTAIAPKQASVAEGVCKLVWVQSLNTVPGVGTLEKTGGKASVILIS